MKKGADISIKDTKGVTPFDMCLEKYRTEDIHAILSLHPIWKNIVLLDGKTKLIDLVFAMKNSNHFSIYLKRLSKNVLTSDSPLWPGYSPLHLAVLFPDSASDSEEMNYPILRNIIKKNHELLYAQDAYGRTPLHLSFLLNKKPVVDLLLEILNEMDFELPDFFYEDGLSCVYIASAQNNIPLLKRMLSTGIDVNAVYKGKSLISRSIYPGSTALHFAVVNGSIEAAEVLMNQGADVYAEDANGMTPIHLLLMNPKADILLSSPNLKDSVVNGIGLSHLHVAARCNKVEAVKKLLDNGANINSVIRYKPDENTEPNEFSFLKRYNAFSSLDMACYKESTSTMKLLLERGADIFNEDPDGKPLLYEVIEEETSEKELRFLLKAIAQSEDRQTILTANTGLKALHIACLINDKEAIKELLREGADVNEKIRADAPIFQGYTPLHITLFVFRVYDVEKSIELLIDKGADVTLCNGASETAVHLAYGMFDDNAEQMYVCLNLMLEAQRDFSVNPENVGGLTHFHIACQIFNARIVKKFLKYAHIDINRPMDYFYEQGDTALHFASSGVIEMNIGSRQLDTVDVLLKHGANVHAEDARGQTPLHNSLCFCYNSRTLDIFERIARAGADVNAKNLDGNTPLHYYFESENITFEGIKTLLRIGCRLNIFTNTDYGCMGRILRGLDSKKLPELFSVIAVNFSQEIAIDDTGRTAIHNIVSDDQIKISAYQYTTLIEILSRAGCDVDCKDQSGRTALHMAAKFYNVKGISGLLLAGADVNETNSNGQTALAYDFDMCAPCQNADENNSVSKHLETLKLLTMHIKKLQFLGLDVNKQDEEYALKTTEKLKIKTMLTKKFFKELAFIKIGISKGSQPIILYDFLSETGAVARYPRMSWLQRDAIKKFFSSSDVENFRKKYPELAGIVQLQYRKARARPQLLRLAGNALKDLTGFQLPDICSDCIFVLLTNSELNNLIASTV